MDSVFAFFFLQLFLFWWLCCSCELMFIVVERKVKPMNAQVETSSVIMVVCQWGWREGKPKKTRRHGKLRRPRSIPRVFSVRVTAATAATATATTTATTLFSGPTSFRCLLCFLGFKISNSTNSISEINNHCNDFSAAHLLSKPHFSPPTTIHDFLPVFLSFVPPTLLSCSCS